MNGSNLTVRVTALRNEASDIKLYELSPLDGPSLPGFAPGSHIDVHVKPGVVRQYSLCSDPADTGRYWIAVKRELQSRGGSIAIHDEISLGHVLTISAPRNNFSLVAGTHRSLLVAGGIGITPMIAMVHELLDKQAPFELHYFVRSSDSVAFRSFLASDAVAPFVSVHTGLSPEGTREALAVILRSNSEDAHLYMCGPRPFMTMVQTISSEAWPAAAIHLENFSADETLLSAAQNAFEVKLASSGEIFQIPVGESIVSVLARHGIELDVSCEQGICGTCLTGVLSGEPEHRDDFLTDAEKEAGDQMMVCVSRAKTSSLTLDL